MSPFGGQGIKQVGGFGGNGGGFGQGMNQPDQSGSRVGGGLPVGFGGGQQSGGFGGNQQGGGFGGMSGGFGGQQGFGGGFGQQQQPQQYNPYQQPQQYNPYQQQQQYNPYQQQQQYNPYQQQQQQFNPYQQQFNPYQQFGYGQRQQMENPYQRQLQLQELMNSGQDRGGFDDSGTGSFLGSQNSFHAPSEGVMGTMGGSNGFLGSANGGGTQAEFDRTVRNAGPTPGGSTNDILKSLVGLGADPNNTAQRTMQDAMNAQQQRQQVSNNRMLDGNRPPFNPYQQFNYGGGSDPRGRSGYKNDRNYNRMPNVRLPDNYNPDGTEMARPY